MKIMIYGWNSGFSKISLNRYLRENFYFSIAEAKEITDKIVNGDIVELECDALLKYVISKDFLEFNLKFNIVD